MHFDQIDWTRPWLAPLRPVAAAIIHAADWRQALNAAAAERALQNHRGLPIRFVPQSDLPPATAYEAFISATGGVPTRDNLHDFFNALAWLTFPKTKACLNELQAMEITRASGVEAAGKPLLHQRGRMRDAATIFDENAALLIIRDMELLDALREHRWDEAFVHRRSAFWHDCEVWLFGHALAEKLVAPYEAITAHAWVIATDDFFKRPADERREWIDSEAANQLSNGLDISRFTPLPVLGVPGWWERQDAAFYMDEGVFRPKRSARR